MPGSSTNPAIGLRMERAAGTQVPIQIGALPKPRHPDSLTSTKLDESPSLFRQTVRVSVAAPAGQRVNAAAPPVHGNVPPLLAEAVSRMEAGFDCDDVDRGSSRPVIAVVFRPGSSVCLPESRGARTDAWPSLMTRTASG